MYRNMLLTHVLLHVVGCHKLCSTNATCESTWSQSKSHFGFWTSWLQHCARMVGRTKSASAPKDKITLMWVAHVQILICQKAKVIVVSDQIFETRMWVLWESWVCHIVKTIWTLWTFCWLKPWQSMTHVTCNASHYVTFCHIM